MVVCYPPQIKMHQASSLSEPCSCGASSPQRSRGQQGSRGGLGASWGPQLARGADLPVAAGSSTCCCSLQGKREVLVGRMQEELQSLQQELCQLQHWMPDAYSTASSS